MENYRSRKHCLLLLYPEEGSAHKKAIEYIKINYDYALKYMIKILIKKMHTHVMISFDNVK